MNTTAEQLMRFIQAAPTAFHTVQALREILLSRGFTELAEELPWGRLSPGGSYFVTRNSSSVISFRLPEEQPFRSFLIMASHSDSPAFRLKAGPELESAGAYVRLNAERYGGMLMSPWFDRPLTLAGRVMVRTGEGASERLIYLDRDLLLIPSLAIHMDREANSGKKLSAQTDLLPLYGPLTAKGALAREIAAAAGVSPEELLSSELFIVNRDRPALWGAENAYLSAPRLDDLACAYCTFPGFLNAENASHVTVHAVFDNEEVGSGTKQGASSTFLRDTLRRISLSLGLPEEHVYTAAAQSFMVSADNAHAVHPAHPEKADPLNRPLMNGGIVIKHSANQKYTTDAVSEAVIRQAAEKAGVPCQVFTNNSDQPGGSTLGNLSSVQAPMAAADIGLAQLSMHSPFETMGAEDPEYLARFSLAFYSSALTRRGSSWRLS